MFFLGNRRVPAAIFPGVAFRVESGFENADIRFTGFWSQGDGASFTADINLEKIINTIVSCGYNTCDMVAFQALEKMVYHGLIDLSFKAYRVSSRYSHENTCTVDMDFECYQDNISDPAYEYLEGLSDQLLSDIEEIRLNLCQEIYKSLEREYEYLTSDMAVKETIEANGYEFTEDGGMI